MKKESQKVKEVFSEELFTDLLSSSEDLLVIRGGSIKKPITAGDGCGQGCGDGCGSGCTGC